MKFIQDEKKKRKVQSKQFNDNFQRFFIKFTQDDMQEKHSSKKTFKKLGKALAKRNQKAATLLQREDEFLQSNTDAEVNIYRSLFK